MSLKFLDQGKGKGKETANIADWEHLHFDGSNEEMVTETFYEMTTRDIFATPHKSKLEWFNASNHYRRLQQEKGPSMVIIGCKEK